MVREQSYFLEIRLGSVLLDELADGGGASERNLVDLHVLGDGCASSWAVAADDVDNTGGEASFLNKLCDVKSR